MTMEPSARQGRFTDFDRGGGVVEGYRDAVREDPFNKKFIARNLKQYDVLKGAGLGNVKNLGRLKNLTDTQLETLATKAVMKEKGYKPRKLPTSYNRKKYNIDYAKRVMARKAAGATVRQQALQQTRQARKHILIINRNRKYMDKALYPGLPKWAR